jgi:hypothetical protein
MDGPGSKRSNGSAHPFNQSLPRAFVLRVHSSSFRDIKANWRAQTAPFRQSFHLEFKRFMPSSFSAAKTRSSFPMNLNSNDLGFEQLS